MKKRLLTSSGKPITAAEENNALDDVITNVKADFDYIIEGLETLGRRGAESGKQAMSIATDISTDLEDHISAIAAAMTKGGSPE